MINKIIFISVLSFFFMNGVMYAQINENQKNNINTRIDSVIENIENNVSKIDGLNKKNDYLNEVMLKADTLEGNFSKKSESYAYLFNYFLSELNKIYAKLHGRVNYGVGLTQNQINNIVDTHNIYRLEVGVDDLVWSDVVAKSAEKWGNVLKEEGCSFRHSTYEFRDNYGENLYTFWSSDTSFSGDNSISAMKALGDEKFDYDYETNTCEPGKICGHYTQMVWKDTTQVGCARIECRDNMYKEVYICQYNPAGNYIGRKPY